MEIQHSFITQPFVVCMSKTADFWKCNISITEQFFEMKFLRYYDNQWGYLWTKFQVKIIHFDSIAYSAG